MAGKDNEVDVKFGAQTDELDAGVNRVKDKVGEVGSSTDLLADKLKELGSVIAASFAVEKLIEFGKATLETAEGIEKLGVITGLTTEKIQTLQFALQMTGSSAEEANVSLTKFSRNIYEAAAGSGPAYEAFQKLGVSLSDLQHGNADEVLNKMAEGFKNIQDPSERVQLAMALFGRSGAALIPILAKGSEGLAEMNTKMKESGDYIDANMIPKMAKLNEDLQLLGKAFEGAGRQILEHFIGPLDKAVNAMTGFMQTIQDLKLIGGAAFDYLADNTYGHPAEFKPGEVGPNQPKGESDINRNPEGQAATAKKNADDLASTYEGQRKLYEADYQAQSQATRNAATDKRITMMQEYDQLRVLLEAEDEAVATSYVEQAKLYRKDSQDYNRVMLEKQVAHQRFIAATLKLDGEESEKQQQIIQKALEKQQQQWNKTFDMMQRGFQKVFLNMFQQTQTFGQFFQQMGQQMASNWLASLARMGAEWIAHQALLTLATITGNTVRTASDVAAAEASKTASKDSGSSKVIGDAKEAAANVYANVSDIPYVGWILAPAAAATAFAAVMAFNSFDKGTPFVDQDQVARIHKGERIIPAAQNAEIMKNGGFGGGGAVHFHVSAMDSKSVKKFFEQHGSSIANAVVSAKRNGHTGMRAAMVRGA